jgi:hypothetical protein
VQYITKFLVEVSNPTAFYFLTIKQTNMSVTITGYKVVLNKQNEEFIALELQGELEMARSSQTGNYYATVRKCQVTSTVDEATANSMIGKVMAGSIEKVPCEEYTLVNTTTGEQTTHHHRYEYVPERAQNPLRVAGSAKAA